MTIRTVITLNRAGKGVEIEATFNNQAKDHRLRAMFPSDLNASVHQVDSMFEVAQRGNEPASEWTNPSNAQHQQAFVDVSEAGAGLTVANFGLNEYEVLRDGRNTIAITLLRSTGELGDWGYFPTPEAQCLGESTVRMELIPHGGNGISSGAYTEAYQFQIPWMAKQTGVHEGSLSACYSLIKWESKELAFSSMKLNPESNDMMLRWYNMSAQETELSLNHGLESPRIYTSDILETEGSDMTLNVNADSNLSLPVKPYEIITLGISTTSRS